MGIKQDRTKDKPPRVDIQFRDWSEYDEFKEYAETAGGKLGPFARVVLLRSARSAAKERAS